MTIEQAAAEYANVYRAWRTSQEVPAYNLEVEIAYATKDVLNMARGSVEVIQMEIEDLSRALPQ